MKIFIYILITIALCLMIFNFSLLDFNHLLGKDSSVALIGVLASLCVILMMVILLISRKIKEKSKKK